MSEVTEARAGVGILPSLQKLMALGSESLLDGKIVNNRDPNIHTHHY
jgi:hypothetical protein